MPRYDNNDDDDDDELSLSHTHSMMYSYISLSLSLSIYIYIGGLALVDLGWQFWGCENLLSTATDVPDLTNITNLSHMFQGCSVFNGDLSGWDVSSVRDMSHMFAHAHSFNSDITLWDTSKVQLMTSMFQDASVFSRDISRWNTTQVLDMGNMFKGAVRFNMDFAPFRQGEWWGTFSEDARFKQFEIQTSEYHSALDIHDDLDQVQDDNDVIHTYTHVHRNNGPRPANTEFTMHTSHYDFANPS